MKCPRCQAENREGARFCRECGVTFAAVCSHCGTKVEAGSKFCDSCGAPLAATAAQPAPPSRFASPESYTTNHLVEKILTYKSALEVDRKQVTVLIDILSGSIEITAGLTVVQVYVLCIGSDHHNDNTSVGHTTHLAARMEQIADPGAIVITPDTLALVEGYVEVKSLGPVPVKGLAGAVEVYEVTA